ncbi:hypothetical protein F0L68_10430 [Solihabitans fulvus]|uniref:Small secreted domain n=1 Tax=Solihabitans fulvus TaxID=1892852 RepID=A0A5B2XJT0_9PSEU|nr:hypothetical protein [Solihabitans fulvus]KAA2263229.1 hypothetical protein F0L68_10430 [Solihabitans fulvus]
MLKKAGVIAAAAAGLMMLGSPAFAADAHDGARTHEGWHPHSLINVLNGNNVNGVLGVCGNNVGVLGAAVPINSPSITHNCAAGGIVGGGQGNG